MTARARSPSSDEATAARYVLSTPPEYATNTLSRSRIIERRPRSFSTIVPGLAWVVAGWGCAVIAAGCLWSISIFFWSQTQNLILADSALQPHFIEIGSRLAGVKI